MSLFSTTGIRGPADTFFTDDFCVHIGFAFGSLLKKKGKTGFVALAMDPRESSPRIKSKVAVGLAITGFEILDEGVIPTPALSYFAKHAAHVAGAIMVTGSHVVANLNGLKFTYEGEEITKAMEQELEHEYVFAKSKSLPAVTPITKIETVAQDQYVAMATELASAPYPKWKIVVDATNGTQTEVVRRVFSNLKLAMKWNGDGNIQAPHFVPCDTDVPRDFSEISRQVLLQKADFGVVFDVDGDRVIFIDDTGRFVPGDVSCALLAKVSSSKTIVTTVSASSIVDHLGKRVYRTPVGSTLVSAKMKETGSTFGFETNGGGISAEILYGRDGLTTALKLMNLMAESKKKLSVLVDELSPRYFLFRDKLVCPTEKFPAVYARVRNQYSEKSIETTDGLKVFLSPDEWLLFRASGTAPEFRVFVQSLEETRAQTLGQKGMELVRSVAVGTQSSHEHELPRQDSHHMAEALRKFPDQIKQVISDLPLIPLPSAFSVVENVVISGMGGSALGGRILANLERQTLRVPLVVSTDYHLPNFVNERSLVVVCSYSGNTEETLESLKEARARNAQIFIITSGGALAQSAQELKIPHYVFSPFLNVSGQPRMGLGYNIMALVMLLSRCQLIHAPKDLSQLSDFLKQEQPESQQLACDLANKLRGTIPLLLASEHLKGAAIDFRNQLHETAKNMAMYFDLPEADHHLLEGLSHPATNEKNLHAIFLESGRYHPRLVKRYAATQDVFSKNHIPTTVLTAKGTTSLSEALYITQLAAMIALELGFINAIDPGPVPWVDYLKDAVH